MAVQKFAVRVLQSFIVCLIISRINCKCKTTYITKCDKISDVSRNGKSEWTNLLIENDACSVDIIETPNEVLNNNSFASALNLQEMYIVGRLVDIRPGAFNGLSQLTYLKLYKNFIKVVPNGAFAFLTKSLKLDLQDNSIENIQHKTFENSAVHWLDLSHNKINNLQVDMVALPSLKRLVITHNDISLLVPHCFHDNLEYLNLDSNNISDINKEVLENLRNLKELILSNNKLPGIAISFALPSLEKLDLSHNLIEGIASRSFQDFPELKILLLGNNRISYINPNIFPEKNIVEILQVHRNALMFLETRLGESLPNLKELSLGGNPWACPCFEEIISYIKKRNIGQPKCDRDFFSVGTSAICWVVQNVDTCSGNERITLEISADFQKALKYYQC